MTAWHGEALLFTVSFTKLVIIFSCNLADHALQDKRNFFIQSFIGLRLLRDDLLVDLR